MPHGQRYALTNFFVTQASKSELKKIFTRKREGSIVFMGDSNAPFLELKEQDRLENLKRMVKDREEVVGVEEEEQTSGSWRKLLKRVFGNNNLKAREKGTHNSSQCYNLYHRKPDFINNYGSTVYLDGSNFSPLNNSGIAVHLLNLTAVRKQILHSPVSGMTKPYFGPSHMLFSSLSSLHLSILNLVRLSNEPNRPCRTNGEYVLDWIGPYIIHD